MLEKGECTMIATRCMLTRQHIGPLFRKRRAMVRVAILAGLLALTTICCSTTTAEDQQGGNQVTPQEIEESSTDSKKRTLINMIKQWGWSPEKLEHYNQFDSWQMKQKVALGNQVNKILMFSYRNISEKNKTLSKDDSLITEKDTHLLGRKLFSFFRKAPNKVENLVTIVDGNTAEMELTFYCDLPQPPEKPTWYLVRGKSLNFMEHIPSENIIKKAATLVSKAKHAEVVEHVFCDGKDHLETAMVEMVELGGEGLMLRDPDSLYVGNRSTSLLKVKRWYDAEAKVIGHQPGKGRHKGRMGALVCVMEDGKEFEVGTGFSDNERENPPEIGVIITYRYRGLTDAGIPKHHSFRRIWVEI